jgi:hypothetical protein
MQYARGLEEPQDRNVDLRTPKHGGRFREGHRERDIASAGSAAGGFGTGEVRVSKAVVTVDTPSFTLVQS